MSEYIPKAGDVWRTSGCYGWARVKTVWPPVKADEEFDGVSVEHSNNGGKTWQRMSWWYPCFTASMFEDWMRNGTYRRWLDGVDEPPAILPMPPQDWEEALLP